MGAETVVEMMGRRVAVGVDWLSLTWQVNRDKVDGSTGEVTPELGLLAEMYGQLEDLRLRADARRQAGEQEPVQLTLAGEVFNVRCGVRYPWRYLLVAVSGVLEVAVAPAEGARPSTPILRCEAAGRPLWERSWGDWVDLARKVAGALAAGAELGAERVSRVDLCCDVEGVDFTGCDEERRAFVTRAKTRSNEEEVLMRHFKGTRFTGYEFGKSDPRGRIYDRTLRSQEKGETWLEPVWRKNGWEGGKVWRLEMQLRRETLRELGVEGWDPKKLDEVWGWAVGLGDARQRAQVDE